MENTFKSDANFYFNLKPISLHPDTRVFYLPSLEKFYDFIIRSVSFYELKQYKYVLVEKLVKQFLLSVSGSNLAPVYTNRVLRIRTENYLKPKISTAFEERYIETVPMVDSAVKYLVVNKTY